MPFPFTQTSTKAKNLKDVIIFSGLKQRYLAMQLGVSETMLSHQIAGRRRMTNQQTKNLAKLLKVKIKDIKRLTSEVK